MGSIVSSKLSMRPTPPNELAPYGDFDPREVVTFRVIDPIRGVHLGQLVTYDHRVRIGTCQMSVSPGPDDIVTRFQQVEPPGRRGRPAPRLDWNTWLIVDDLGFCGISRPLSMAEAKGAHSPQVRRLKRLLRR